jgi:predicted nucleotidyltransferase
LKEKNRLLKEERKKELGYELDRIINVLRKDIKIKLILLFGSLARGDMNRMSDIDMIIVKETGKKFLDRLDEIYYECDEGWENTA